MGSERLFLRFKKTSGNGLVEETATLVNDLIDVLTLNNVKINVS